MASYETVWILAHTQIKRILDEEMIKISHFGDSVRNLWGKNFKRHLQILKFSINPLSNFAYRIQEVSNHIKDKLIKNLKNFKYSSLNELCNTTLPNENFGYILSQRIPKFTKNCQFFV